MTTPTTNPGEIRVDIAIAKRLKTAAVFCLYKSKTTLFAETRVEALTKCATTMEQLCELAHENPSLRCWIRGELEKIGGLV